MAKSKKPATSLVFTGDIAFDKYMFPEILITFAKFLVIRPKNTDLSMTVSPFFLE